MQYIYLNTGMYCVPNRSYMAAFTVCKGMQGTYLISDQMVFSPSVKKRHVPLKQCHRPAAFDQLQISSLIKGLSRSASHILAVHGEQ